MAAGKSRVFLADDRLTQHHASAPDDLSTREWNGTTDCGRSGPLLMVHDELVDMGALCPDCHATSGVRPPLAGNDRGPV